MEDNKSLAKHNESLSQYYKNRLDYKQVTVLVIYWQNSLEPGFRDEGLEVGKLFREGFNYKVEFFEIPSLNSQLRLNARVSRLLLENEQPGTLLVIHYGGHGDEDDMEGHKRLSVWALDTSESSPMLSWSEVQPILKLHSSEALVLLDCCYASQAARGAKISKPNNVELWVACGLNVKTVLPGPHSFTSQMLCGMKESLKKEGHVKISTLHNELASRYSTLTQSAIHYPLDNLKGSITLRPLVAYSNQVTPSAPDAGYLTLRLSIAKLDSRNFNDTLDEILKWLKLNPPQAVSNVNIEQLIHSVTAVTDYITEDESRSKGVAAFSELSTTAREDVVSAWTTFSNTIARMASYMPTSLVQSTAEILEKDLPTTYVEDFTNSFEPVQRSIERNIMAIPKLSQEAELRKAVDDPELKALGLEEMLKLRVLARFAPENVRVATHISVTKPKGLFPSRTIDKIPEMSQSERVLIEAKRFEEHVDDRVLLKSKSRLESLSLLLESKKSGDFHALSCLGFFYEPAQAYGLIFQIPSNARKNSVSLQDIILKRVKGLSKPSIGQRLHIAHKIGMAILKWHLVGWVHQGIASYNILFFYDDILGVDYDNPYLSGFEYARKHSAPSTSRIVEHIEMNIYRHPDRQGMPNASHQKEHDIYSYGILLLELGLWDTAHRVLNLSTKEISPSEMAQRLQDVAKKELGFYAGVDYQRATSKCLKDDFGVKQDDKVNSVMAKAFEMDVLREIEKGILMG